MWLKIYFRNGEQLFNLEFEVDIDQSTKGEKALSIKKDHNIDSNLLTDKFLFHSWIHVTVKQFKAASDDTEGELLINVNGNTYHQNVNYNMDQTVYNNVYATTGMHDEEKYNPFDIRNLRLLKQEYGK